MHDCLIAFGSNLGDGPSIYGSALSELDDQAHVLVGSASQLVETRAVGGPPDQPPFRNGAIRIQTDLDVVELHRLTTGIENSLGRQRRRRWGPRSIDLDLLLFDELILQAPHLSIPHPRMSFRRFVLQPANEIAGQMFHPVCGATIKQLLNHLNTRPNEIVWLAESTPPVMAVIENVRADIADRDWSIQLIGTPEAFEQRLSSAKVLIVGQEAPFEWTAHGYRGPMLFLGDQNRKAEIMAAIDAMTPNPLD
jgi:2-amino-4-hydroxy-6-hydroxymethyldihydropteridine diphosphokinase